MTVTPMPPLSADIVDPYFCAPWSSRLMVQRVIETMRDGFDRPPTLDDLADVAGLSVYHFHRVFRAETGIAPGEFLTIMRLQQAKRLLLTTSLSVTDICYEVGYASLGTFTARFSQLVGIAPGRLRQFADTAALPSVQRLSEELSMVPQMPLALTGTVSAPTAPRGPIFIGLFPKPIPQARPIASALLTAPGQFQMAAVPDGRHYLLAASLPWAEDPRVPMLTEAGLLVGAGPQPLLVQHGRCRQSADVALRLPLPTDPPILSSLPFFLAQRLTGVRNAA
jgi:AraC family transcriptional regulator